MKESTREIIKRVENRIRQMRNQNESYMVGGSRQMKHHQMVTREILRSKITKKRKRSYTRKGRIRKRRYTRNTRKRRRKQD